MSASAPVLYELECPVTEDMTYWEYLNILGNNSYNYTDDKYNHPNNIDYDDPRDYEEWCDWNDTETVEGYYYADHLHEDGGFVYFKDAFELELDQAVRSGDVYTAGNYRPCTELQRCHPVMQLLGSGIVGTWLVT